MDQWEYTWIATMPPPTSLKKSAWEEHLIDDAERLNEYGAEGWEIILTGKGGYLAKRLVTYFEND